MNSPHIDRRHFLTLAGTLTAVGLTAPTADATRYRTDPPGRLSPSLPQMKHHNSYRPLPISDPRELPHFPSDARLVPWRWSRASKTSIQDAVATLGPNDVLVLPEDERPFEVDTSRGFRVTRHNYHSMAHLTRGIVGLGPGAVIRPSASAFRMGHQRYSRGLQEKLIECRTAHAYLGNFTMYGRDLGGCAYNATWASGTGTTWERIHFRGAHRGWLAQPPGEAGAICGYRGGGMRVYNCEIDCRDESGTSVGPSPCMWNSQTDVKLSDVYAHHTYVGMPSFWKVHNAVATNLIHSHGAQGYTWSPGVNVEACSGTFEFNRCTFMLGSIWDNNGMHLNTGRQSSSVQFDITDPTIDAGRWPGLFSIHEYKTSAQRRSDYNITNSNGSPYGIHIK